MGHTSKNPNSPPPHMHISFQGEKQVSEQPLVHGRPLEFWDAEHGGARTGAELPALFLRHGHASETQVNTQVPLQLRCRTTVQGLQRGGWGKDSVSRQRAFSASRPSRR